MAPNPYEKGKYNIPNDYPDSMISLFDNKGVYTFWAPLKSEDDAGAGGNADDEINALIDDMLKAPGNAKRGGDPAKVREAIKTAMKSYMTHLKAGQGEDLEGYKIVRIVNPIRLPASQTGLGDIIHEPAKYVATKKADLNTSWDTYKDGDVNREGGARGRDGYSVKFVSFRSLMTQSILTDGVNSFHNIPSMPDDSSNDVGPEAVSGPDGVQH
jgi:hypothetical protein